MHRKGQSTDVAVLEEITKKPGITVAEIAEELDWTNGRIDGSVNRIIAQGKASVKHNLKKGMLVKSIYPKESHTKLPNQLEIPCDLIDPKLWKEKAFVYALSRSTIGVAPKDIEEWREKALSKEIVCLKKNEGTIAMKLPERIADFYQLQNSENSISAVGDLILVTVESILPVTRIATGNRS